MGENRDMVTKISKLIRSTDDLMALIRNGSSMTRGEKMRLAAWLSMPSMLAQLSTIVMEYIDAAMVGSLGAEASAAIGLVSTTIWLMGGLCSACATGFYVQVAHCIGAKDFDGARAVLRQSIVAVLTVGVALMLIGIAINHNLPIWLGGDQNICTNASLYFLIVSISLPIIQLNMLAGGMLRSSGNMHVPSMLNVLMCFLDVVFNLLLIFPTRTIALGNIELTLPGAGMGIVGAALGTLIAIAISASLMLWFLFCKSEMLSLKGTVGRFRPQKNTIIKALKISLPMSVEHTIFCGAQIVITIIVAPLGTAAIAANAFGIIVESLCYMPGYGIGESATTLVGQSLGAGREQLARSFARITVGMGMGVMTMMGIVMYATAPWVMQFMTPDLTVQSLTVSALRIEAFAEPMFAASIVAYGVFVGAGDTLMPCVMNLISIWGVRIVLSALLVGRMGLNGVWIAMCIELCFRGVIFLVRLAGKKWSRKR